MITIEKITKPMPSLVLGGEPAAHAHLSCGHTVPLAPTDRRVGEVGDPWRCDKCDQPLPELYLAFVSQMGIEVIDRALGELHDQVSRESGGTVRDIGALLGLSTAIHTYQQYQTLKTICGPGASSRRGKGKEKGARGAARSR